MKRKDLFECSRLSSLVEQFPPVLGESSVIDEKSFLNPTYVLSLLKRCFVILAQQRFVGKQYLRGFDFRKVLVKYLGIVGSNSRLILT